MESNTADKRIDHSHHPLSPIQYTICRPCGLTESGAKWSQNLPEASGYSVQIQSPASKRRTFGSGLCDACEVKFCGGQQVYAGDDFLYFCSNCHVYLQSLPSGKIKDSIMAFLIGNVV